MRTEGITSEKLKRLHALRAERATTAQDIEAKVRALIPPETWELMKEAQWHGREALDLLDREASKLEAEIKQEVLAYGHSVGHPCGLQAVYVRGRLQWNGRALDGYALAHPEILPLRREGMPSVYILLQEEKGSEEFQR